MDLIPSFQVDHTKIVPGIYVSRVDTLGDQFATTFDVRMKRPNAEPVVHANAMHTIEHIVATFLRNDDEWKDRIIYWGPMGCLTGCYLIVKGQPTSADVLPLMLRAFEHCAAYEGEVPGADPQSCGNYIFHDLNMARWEAARYVEVLRSNPGLEYPTTERITTERGMTFFDS
ncbi:MAG: S-ribosylhomocysteine lyase [Eggerthellaceae bacterium]|nr:S-ribosylhomocysteine lyase [Eggerthellaceae bacterium]